jgi:predicted aspartyl protease
MGLTFVDITIRKVKGTPDTRTVRCLVDSGATLTVVPGATLDEIGVERDDSVTFELADGSTVTRRTGWMYVEFNGHAGYSPVAFGEAGDSELLGMLTLENLKLWLDPIHRELHPMKQTLKRQRAQGI